MLGKLLKYEMKATARTFLPMYAILLVFSLLGRFSVAGMSDFRMQGNEFLNMVFVLVLVGYMMLMLSTMIITFIVIVQRFYKNLTGEEGYLMHTLPVSTHSLVLSKVIAGSIWQAASGLMIFLSLFVLLFQPWFLKDLAEALMSIGPWWAEFVAAVGAGRVTLLAVEMLASILLGAVSSTLMIYAAIAIGHTFKNHRLLGSAVAYIGLMMICQMVSGFVGVAVSFPFVNETYNMHNMAGLTTLMMDFMNSTIGLALLMSVAFSAAWYFITHYILSSQLNLE